MVALCAAVVFSLFIVSPTDAYAADCFNKESAVELYVDDSMVTPVESMEIDGEIFACIKSFAVVMGAESVKCDQGSVTVQYNSRSIEFKEQSRLAIVDGYYYIIGSGQCCMENNTLVAPMELLYRAFSSSVYEDAENSRMYITTGAGLDEDLTADEIQLLARLVQAEAGNQSLEGKIAVANVVINRIDSSYFPSTISGIIFDTNSGIQFTTAYNGAIYNTPSDECYEAVYDALEGTNMVGNCLFFSSTADCWASRNRTLMLTIGDHYFYA